MKGISPLELVTNGLRNIALPPLRRPPVKPNEDPTEELVRWGTTLYTYSVVAHMQRILSGLLQVAQAENIPVSFVISRHVFEWAAHTCYMSRNLNNYFQRREWGRAWDVLTVAAIGNLWARQHGQKYAPPETPLPNAPDPLRVSNIISAYENYQVQTHGVNEAKDTYGLLSEHSHPNSACFQLYHHYEANGLVRFGDPDPTSPLPFVNWCLIDLLTFIHALLELGQETAVRPRIVTILEELSKLAPTARTW